MISDNGVEFTHRLHTGGTGAFDEHLDDLNIAHICSSPGHPTTCGKVERYHRTTKDWLATQPPAATIAELQNQLDAWRNYYNHQRPHSSLHGPTPAEAFAAEDPNYPKTPAAKHPKPACTPSPQAATSDGDDGPSAQTAASPANKSSLRRLSSPVRQLR